jgi:predicted TIM-barrel fold metal-dependent hydrolase
MARDGFKVFDSDMHVLEPVDLWERYMDGPWKHRAPRGTARTPMDVGVQVDGVDAFQLSPQIARVSFQGGLDRFADDIARGFDAVAQLRAMDREGIDVTVLYPSRGLFANSDARMEPDLSAAISRAYNDWLADFCQAGDPARMYGAAMVPVQDVDLAIREARRAVETLGFKAVFLRPNPPRPGVYWHHARFDPLWTAVQDLGVPVGFHEGVACRMPTVGDDRFDGDLFSLQHACSHAMEQMLAVEAMTLGGVLARFPRLRVAFLEGNGSWLPFWLWRLDEHWANPGRYENPALALRPSEYFRRQCWVSVECEETPAPAAVEQCGADGFVFSTDYPHYDTKYPEATAHFLKLPLSDQAKRKILWDNCARLYRVA